MLPTQGHPLGRGEPSAVGKGIVVDVSYVGSRTVGAGTTKAFNALSVPNLALGDATQGGNPNYLNTQVPNPFAGLLPGTSLNNATVTRQQLLLPYPEFTGSLALALAGLGQLDEAYEAVTGAIESAGGPADGQQWYVPELLRIKGEVLFQQGSERVGLAGRPEGTDIRVVANGRRVEIGGKQFAH